MKKYLILTILLFSVTSCFAEINYVIDNYKINLRNYQRCVIGRFEFLSAPEPLKETTVLFTLEFIDPSKGNYTGESLEDWEVKVGYSDKKMELRSDSVFIWSGPRKIGDKYSGEIRFVPLASGEGGFQVITACGSLPVKWILNENGKLLYLNNPNVDGSYDNVDKYLRTYYFDKAGDQINFKIQNSSSRLFNSEITLSPIPQIGDTSNIIIRMRSNTDTNNGLVQLLRTENMEVVSFPEVIDYSIIRDQVIDCYLQFVPLPINSDITLSIQFISDDILSEVRKNEYRLSLVMLFNNDGTLRYINDESLSNKENYIPTSFETVKKKRHFYKVPKNRNENVKVIK